MINRCFRPSNSMIILASLLVAAPSCTKQNANSGVKATVEVVNGVKTIRNPETPRYGTFAFDLVENLVIGEEKDEAYFFPGRVQLGVDGQGRLFVSDTRNRRVQVYDRNGAYVRTLGRPGQGPGEFNSFPVGVFVDRLGDAYINAGFRSLVVFGADGIFKKSIPIKTGLSGLMLGPGGTIVGRTQPSPWEEDGLKNKLLQFGPGGEMLRMIATYPANGVSPAGVLTHWYVGQLALCPRSDDSFYYGFSLDYTVHVADGEGRDIFAFNKAEAGKAITGQEADLTRDGGVMWTGQGDGDTAPLDLPDHRPFFTRFYSDDLGRLYVIRFRPITEKDIKTSEIDVFSKDGYYLYRMTWPFVPQVIKGGFLYQVRQDEEAGLTKIIRHRIKNWGAFRAE
ncbi:MAG TPA: 6-bladed beta-propeller [Acidobacteriota bacterium]|nr:6-bladed beta-propeller [Acidobacteriota bacterium]